MLYCRESCSMNMFGVELELEISGDPGLLTADDT